MRLKKRFFRPYPSECLSKPVKYEKCVVTGLEPRNLILWQEIGLLLSYDTAFTAYVTKANPHIEREGERLKSRFQSSKEPLTKS